jgi:hypothetical protein
MPVAPTAALLGSEDYVRRATSPHGLVTSLRGLQSKELLSSLVHEAAELSRIDREQGALRPRNVLEGGKLAEIYDASPFVNELQQIAYRAWPKFGPGGPLVLSPVRIRDAGDFVAVFFLEAKGSYQEPKPELHVSLFAPKLGKRIEFVCHAVTH